MLYSVCGFVVFVKFIDNRIDTVLGFSIVCCFILRVLEPHVIQTQSHNRFRLVKKFVYMISPLPLTQAFPLPSDVRSSR